MNRGTGAETQVDLSSLLKLIGEGRTLARKKKALVHLDLDGGEYAALKRVVVDNRLCSGFVDGLFVNWVPPSAAASKLYEQTWKPQALDSFYNDLWRFATGAQSASILLDGQGGACKGVTKAKPFILGNWPKTGAAPAKKDGSKGALAAWRAPEGKSTAKPADAALLTVRNKFEKFSPDVNMGQNGHIWSFGLYPALLCECKQRPYSYAQMCHPNYNTRTKLHTTAGMYQ
jgi:hypothetical protein